MIAAAVAAAPAAQSCCSRGAAGLRSHRRRGQPTRLGLELCLIDLLDGVHGRRRRRRLCTCGGALAFVRLACSIANKRLNENNDAPDDCVCLHCLAGRRRPPKKTVRAKNSGRPSHWRRPPPNRAARAAEPPNGGRKNGSHD
jgi:hypothetical protein